MLESLTALMENVLYAIQNNTRFLLSWLGVLWGVHVLNAATGYRLNILGICPRSLFGVVGIAFAPFLHGSFSHLFINSILFFCLASLVSLSGIDAFYLISISINLIAGVLTWCFGRRAYHVGASSLIMGYWGYLLVMGYTQGDVLAILISGVCFYFFVEMAANLVPSEAHVSWEGHLFGFIGGLITSFLLVNSDSGLHGLFI